MEKANERLIYNLENTEYKYTKTLSEDEKNMIDTVLSMISSEGEYYEFKNIALSNIYALSNFDTGILTDGVFTMDDLKDHIATLFAILATMIPDNAWVSERDWSGNMIKDGYFLCGFFTTYGPVTYYFEPKYRYYFAYVKEIQVAPIQDNMTINQKMDRLKRAFFAEQQEVKLYEESQSEFVVPDTRV